MKTENAFETVNVKFIPETGEYQATYNGHEIVTGNKSYMKGKLLFLAKDRKPLNIVYGESKSDAERAATVESFDINQRFTFVEKLVQMVARKQQASVVITGEGGLGKTFTVLKSLKAEGLEDYSVIDGLADGTILSPKRFVVVKGYSSAKGLFRFLYENNGAVIVFDDCDSILKDRDALMLLKGALDSYDRRIITWNTDNKDADLPKAFEFTGYIVFISNMDLDHVDQAVKSRSMCVDLTMTTEQKLERMEFIIKSQEFLPGVSHSVKVDALNLIKRKAGIAKEISLRTLISVAKIRAAHAHDWENLATYMLCH